MNMNGSHAAAMAVGLIAAVCFHAVSNSASSQETSMSAVQLRPGVVIDPDRKLAYIMSVEGGIDALDVAQGTPVWTTKDAAMPLGLKDDMLIAQMEPTDTSRELKVVALDTRKRGQPMVTGSMMLPAGSQATIDDTLAGSFVASASGLGDDALVSWKFTKRDFRGIPPLDESDDDAGNEIARSIPPSSGTLRLDLSSGEMSNVSTANAAQPWCVAHDRRARSRADSWNSRASVSVRR